MKRKRSNTVAAMLSAIMLIVMSAPAFAQTRRGTVTGAVTDPQGAVIQGATAELRNTGTNQTRTSTTNESGLSLSRPRFCTVSGVGGIPLYIYSP